MASKIESKIMSLREATKLVPNGAHISLGGFTTLGVLRFDGRTKRAYLASYHPGVTPKQVQENTGFRLDVSRTKETEPPTEAEIKILHEKVDPKCIFLKKAEE